VKEDLAFRLGPTGYLSGQIEPSLPEHFMHGPELAKETSKPRLYEARRRRLRGER
jgi:hypothetical protein